MYKVIYFNSLFEHKTLQLSCLFHYERVSKYVLPSLVFTGHLILLISGSLRVFYKTRISCQWPEDSFNLILTHVPSHNHPYISLSLILKHNLQLNQQYLSTYVVGARHAKEIPPIINGNMWRRCHTSQPKQAKNQCKLEQDRSERSFLFTLEYLRQLECALQHHLHLQQLFEQVPCAILPRSTRSNPAIILSLPFSS